MQTFIILAIVFALTAFIAYVNYQNARPFWIESSTTLPADDALARIRRDFALDGWLLSDLTSSSAVMSRRGDIPVGSTLLLGMVSWLLALLRVSSATKRLTVTISTEPKDFGATVRIEGSRRGGLLRPIAAYLRGLPK